MICHPEKNSSEVIKVWVSPKSVKRTIGMTNHFTCEVDHDREYTVEWTFYGQPLPRNAEVDDMVLIIKNVTLQNSGSYMCFAKGETQQGSITSAGAVGRLLVQGEIKCPLDCVIHIAI